MKKGDVPRGSGDIFLTVRAADSPTPLAPRARLVNDTMSASGCAESASRTTGLTSAATEVVPGSR